MRYSIGLFGYALIGFMIGSIAFIAIVLLLMRLDCLSFNIGDFWALCAVVCADVLLFGVAFPLI